MQVGSIRTRNIDLNTEEKRISISQAYLYCRDLTRRNAKNFYLAFLFLSWVKRRSIYAVYSFCRYSDDLVDDPAIQDRPGMLHKWREDLEACYQGEPPSQPILIALQDTIKRFAIPKQYFLDLIDGMEMDLSISRYRSFDELYQYAYKAASVVGLILVEIFGYRNSRTREYAKNLGIAMQLTNIIRDVKEDAGRGRIYLPQEDLQRFKLSEAELINSKYQPSFIQLMEYQAARAIYYYQKATSLIPPEDRGLLTSAEIMKNIYFHLLREMKQQGFNVFRRRIESSKLTKIFIALRTWFRMQIWRR